MEKELYFSFKQYCGVLEKGEHLLQMPVRIGPDTLPDELEMLMNCIGKRGFISYKNVLQAQILIWFVLEKLEAYYKACPEEARVAGEKMISFLEKLETDDDTFPAYDVDRIRDIINT